MSSGDYAGVVDAALCAHLLVLLGMVGKHLRRLKAMRKEVPLHVRITSILDQLLSLSRLQVVLGELLGRAQVGAERTVVARDDNGARARGGALDDLVD